MHTLGPGTAVRRPRTTAISPPETSPRNSEAPRTSDTSPKSSHGVDHRDQRVDGPRAAPTVKMNATIGTINAIIAGFRLRMALATSTRQSIPPTAFIGDAAVITIKMMKTDEVGESRVAVRRRTSAQPDRPGPTDPDRYRPCVRRAGSQRSPTRLATGSGCCPSWAPSRHRVPSHDAGASHHARHHPRWMTRRFHALVSRLTASPVNERDHPAAFGGAVRSVLRRLACLELFPRCEQVADGSREGGGGVQHSAHQREDEQDRERRCEGAVLGFGQ
jgi:hypothetical protein